MFPKVFSDTLLCVIQSYILWIGPVLHQPPLNTFRWWWQHADDWHFSQPLTYLTFILLLMHGTNLVLLICYKVNFCLLFTFLSKLKPFVTSVSDKDLFCLWISLWQVLPTLLKHGQFSVPRQKQQKVRHWCNAITPCIHPLSRSGQRLCQETGYIVLGPKARTPFKPFFLLPSFHFEEVYNETLPHFVSSSVYLSVQVNTVPS